MFVMLWPWQLINNLIVKDVYSDFYEVIDGPLPVSSFAYSDNVTKYNFDANSANSKLDSSNWTKINLGQADLTTNLSRGKSDYCLCQFNARKCDWSLAI